MGIGADVNGRTLQAIALLVGAVFVIGCGTKVEIENHRSSRLETAEATVEETEASRINVLIEAGTDEPEAELVHLPKLATPAASPERPSTANAFDERLCGKWRIAEGDVDGTVRFTPGGNVLFVWYHRGLGRDWTQTGSYGWTGPATIRIEESGNYASESTKGVEFLADDELLITKQAGYGFTWLFGRLERVE
jgi:hypothetical protein